MNREKLSKLTTDLRKQAPRSPKLKLGSFAHLARMIDKCRATLLEMNGEYHYNCPTDRRFFDFTKLDHEKLKEFISTGASDNEILAWVLKESKLKDADVKAWTANIVSLYPVEGPGKEWFEGECKKLSLNPMQTTLFDYLEVDDKATFR